VERFISKHLKSALKNGFLYLTKDGVYFNQRNLGPLAEHFFFVHAGMKIGSIKGNIFTPTHHIFWCLSTDSTLEKVSLTADMWNQILRQKFTTIDRTDGYYLLSW
jgi:NOL1/NOP2/fmu family ribosome biogenesis protein